MKSVMVDIETLSTQSDACVISMGFALFDTQGGVLDTTGCAIHTDDWHGHIDPKTVKWWSEQAPEARDYSFNGKTTALAAAVVLKIWLENADEVWANSPQFDLTILRNWWKRVGMKGAFPAIYRNERDCRTIFNESRRLGLELGNQWLATSVAHNPIDDAANQARAIVQWRKHYPGTNI